MLLLKQEIYEHENYCISKADQNQQIKVKIGLYDVHFSCNMCERAILSYFYFIVNSAVITKVHIKILFC